MLLTLVGVEGHVIGVSIGERGEQFIFLNRVIGPSLFDICAPNEIIDYSRIHGSTVLTGSAHLVPIQRNDVTTIGGSEVLDSTRHIRTDIDGHLFTLQALARLIVRDCLISMVSDVIRFVNIDHSRARSDVLNATHNGAVTQDVDSRQVGSQRRTVDGDSGSSNRNFGTQCSLLVGNNADDWCSRSRGLGTKVNADVFHHEAILVGIADGMNSQIILASLIHREHTLVFLAHVFIGGDIGGLNDRCSQGLSSGFGTQQHLKTLINSRIIGIDNYRVILACLKLHRKHDKVVIGSIVWTVIVIGMVSIIPIPCAAVLVGINHREDVEGFGLRQIGGIGHIKRGNEFHGHNLALVAGALLVIGNSIILVQTKSQVITVVYPSQRCAGCQVLEGVDQLVVAHEFNLFQIGSQGLAIAF